MEHKGFHKCFCIWLTGLPCSGKTTIASSLYVKLSKEHKVAILDGDNFRKNFTPNLGYSEADRYKNLMKAADVAMQLASRGLVVICAFITPYEKVRITIRDMFKKRYFEVYVSCPPEICEERDVKGMWAKARSGEIKEFTGIDSLYEEPLNPDIIVRTHIDTDIDCVKQIIQAFNKKVEELDG